jgi:hypothetical protein
MGTLTFASASNSWTTSNNRYVAGVARSATATINNITVTGSTFTLPAISANITNSITGNRTPSSSAVCGPLTSAKTTYTVLYNGASVGSYSQISKSMSLGATAGKTTSTSYSSTASWSGGTKNTGTYFNSSNATSRTVSFSVQQVSVLAGTLGGEAKSSSNTTTASGTVVLTLNAPPTFSNTAMTFDKPYVYSTLTTASVDVSDLSAKYGGYITRVELKIGNQTATLADPTAGGTVSILLNTAGTFTPTITVTDSRGQTTSKNLESITVNAYNVPSANIDVDRVDADGIIADEGAYGLITADVTYTNAITNLLEPTVTVDGAVENVTWYSDRALTQAIDWTNYNPASPVTIYGHFGGSFSTQLSYLIGFTPKDGLNHEGTTQTQTLATAFYTIDFRAGGHGIAFGQACRQDGFFCGMDAHFKHNDEVLPLADFVVEQGISDIWTYRKWASGIAECWGNYTTSIAVNIASPGYGGYRSDAINIPTFPFTFTSVPSIMAMNITPGGAWVNNVGKTTAGTYYFYLSAGSSYTASSRTIGFYVIGKWK